MALSVVKRPMTTSELCFFDCQMNTDLGIQFDSPEFVPIAVQRLKERILGLQLRCEDGWMYHTDDPIDVCEIPKDCNTPKLATKWVIRNNMPDPRHRLATLSAGKDCVVVSMNHMIGDGTYLLDTLRDISRDFKPTLPKLPTAPEKTFEKDIEILKKKGPPAKIYHPEDLTRLFPKEAEPKDKVRHPIETIEYRVNTQEMLCYHRFSNKVHNLTEALFGSLLLSAIAYNDKLDAPLAGYACVNLRQYLPKSLRHNPAFCNHFSDVIVASTAGLDETIGRMYKQFKHTLKSNIKNKECLRTISDLGPGPQEGLQFEVSNEGKAQWSKPVKAVCFHSGCGYAGRPKTIDLFCHSMIIEPFNNIEMKLEFNPADISYSEANIIGKSVAFGLVSISEKMTIREAISAFQGYQKVLRESR